MGLNLIDVGGDNGSARFAAAFGGQLGEVHAVAVPQSQALMGGGDQPMPYEDEPAQ